MILPMMRKVRRWQWQRVMYQLEELHEEQKRCSRGRKGPPTDEEREWLKSLAKRGRVLADREARIRARGI